MAIGKKTPEDFLSHLDNDGQRGGGRLWRISVVHGQDLDLVRRRRFPVELALDGHGAVLRDGELPAAVRAAIDQISDLAVAALVGIRGPEPLQGLSDSRVLADKGLDVGLLEDRLVVVDVAQFDDHPGVGHVVLVVVVVLALVVHLDPEPEALSL